MSFKLSTSKPLNNNISKSWITTNDDELLFLETEKGYSHEVKRNEKFNTLSMSLTLTKPQNRNHRNQN